MFANLSKYNNLEIRFEFGIEFVQYCKYEIVKLADIDNSLYLRGVEMSKGTVIDRLINKLSVGQTGDEQNKDQVIKMLREDFIDVSKLAKMLEAEANSMVYGQLKQESEKLIAEKREQTVKIKELLHGLGEEVSKPILEDFNPDPLGDFSEIFKMENKIGSQLLSQSIWAEDSGFRHEAKVLRDLKKEHTEHREVIEKLITKINS